MKRAKLLIAFGIMAIACSGATGVATANIPTSNHLRLDAYEPNNDGFAGAVTSNVLPAGSHWVAEVQGTINYYFPSYYGWVREPWPVVCGTPDDSGPMFPSEDRSWYKTVGQDPEFVFARPWTKHRCDANPLPKHWNNFQISRGAGFGHIAPLGAPLTGPTADHKYVYPITGIGASAKFRLKDRPRTSDNYGVLKIKVRPATGADCASGGFVRFGFADEASCATGITAVSPA
ncbi:MAG: hypothetical protein JWR63_404 [Conexibacter sp.]|nr:hypothetical protein [Conexibacter sp.]